MQTLNDFDEIVLVDFEFGVSALGRPAPRCMVAKELRSGATHRVGEDALLALTTPPFPMDAKTLYVAYAAQAELTCHLALGWPLPARILDLYVEFRNHTNGLCAQNSLVSALSWFGLPHIDHHEKAAMRELALRGGPWQPGEAEALLAYCETDVVALERLLPEMVDHISLPHALLRGHYVRAVARIDLEGVPVDASTAHFLDLHRETLRQEIVGEVAGCGVYAGTIFKEALFETWLRDQGIAWPLLSSGRLDLSKETFSAMAEAHPAVRPLRNARRALSDLKRNRLVVAPDGHSRSPLWPFGTKTGRNRPGNSSHAFGLPGWMRGLIRPPRGEALAYIDWCQQEFGIAAALSGDTAMWAAYQADDPYVRFGIDAGVLPPDATADSHPVERARLKACALGVLFGKSSRGLALDLDLSEADAEVLISAHRRAYPRFWAWITAVVDHAMLFGSARTVFGWQLHRTPKSNPRTFMNFPMQANGAEMMRLAACYGLDAGVRICTPVHDAFLIRAPEGQIDEAIGDMRAAMARASRVVLGGKELRTDVQCVDAETPLLSGPRLDVWRRVRAAVERIAGSEVFANEQDGAHQHASGALL